MPCLKFVKHFKSLLTYPQFNLHLHNLRSSQVSLTIDKIFFKIAMV